MSPPLSPTFQMSERIQSFDAQAVAGCLQRFLLDLPSPVFPAQLFPRLLQIFAAPTASSSSTTTKALRALLGFSQDAPPLPPPPVLTDASPGVAPATTSEWHPVHRGTFDFLMAHLCRVWSIQASLNLIREGPPTQLVTAFSVLLIAPAWPDICQLVKIKPTLTTALETLLFDFDWGEDIRELVVLVRSLKPPAPPSRPVPVGPPQKPSPHPQLTPSHPESKGTVSSSPSKPSSLSSTPPPSQQRLFNNNNNNPSPIPHQGTPVAGCSCYWGSISRDDANNLLKGTTDGTFLIRDSYRDPQIPYALHVQFHGQSRPIQILVSPEGKYGFADRNLFHDSVFHLIDYHRTVSLEEFNRELKDLKLVKPLMKKARPPPGLRAGAMGGEGAEELDESAAQELESPDPKLANQLLQIHAKWLVKQNDYEEKYEEHAEVMARLQDHKQALEAFRQTVLIYEHQVELHQRMTAEVDTETDRNTMAANFEMLLRSLKEVKSERAKLEERNEEDAILIRQLANHINQLKPEIGALMTQKQELIRQLTQASYSCNNEMIEDIFREAFRSLWYTESYSREDAITALSGKRDSTFLIRKASQPGKFSLSIVHGGRVMHARIERFKQSLDYGGVEGYVYCFDNRYMFPSLDLMVQHYYRKSLKDHNPQLDTFLKYPVGYYLNQSAIFADDEGELKDADFSEFPPRSVIDVEEAPLV